MIVYFPDLNTLQLALAAGAVPPDVAEKPAVAGFGAEEQIWVETAAEVQPLQRELKRLGALVCQSCDVNLNTEVLCWPQLLPLVRDNTPLDALEKMPVLFDVPSGEELSRLVLEMLRLGNDRQSYRWLEEVGTQNTGKSRALLRVVGPPYYSLLRAIDSMGGPENAPQAFREGAPDVWVEIGYQHPLVDKIRSPKGQILLLRPPRQWLILPDAPFRDIYEGVEFQIPGTVNHWKDSPLPQRFTVSLRLRQAGAGEGAELWVLRGDAIGELNRFVQNSEDQLLNRFAFAVCEKNGQTIVVLRVRPSKLPPPVLVLPAEAYKSYLKLPNLFLPVGFALHPPLRREVVCKLLGEDPRQITWLAPAASGERESAGSFVAESLPDDVFRPLTDWVDYVLEHDHESLQAWVQAMQFEFEPFICDEEQRSKPKKPRASKRKRNRETAPPRPAAEQEVSETTAFEASAETASEESTEKSSVAPKVEPTEIEEELHAVEKEFLELPGGLEDASRLSLWPRLAELNARLLKWEDASICWLNTLWDAGEEAGKWISAWLRTEMQCAIRNPQSAYHSLAESGERSVDVLEVQLTVSEPVAADLRAFAAYLAWSAQREQRPPPLMQRLPALLRFLEKHEKLLPVRACWLAWWSLARLTDGDVLALARARDRLLERLYQNGLRPEQDLPSFLRFAGHPDSRRCREIREWLKRLCEKARIWIEYNRDLLDRQTPTIAYSDLLFAFGLARLGENDDAKRLLLRAHNVLNSGDRVHRFLLKAFEARIQDALDGKPHSGPLPPALVKEMEGMSQLDRYVIERVCHNSRILEPERQVDPYRHWSARQSDLDKVLAELVDLNDSQEIQTRLRELLSKTSDKAEASAKSTAGQDRLKILGAGLDLGPRLGEEFTREMLRLTLPALDALPLSSDRAVLEEHAKFLEKALFAAAHFGCSEHVRPLVKRFCEILRTQRGEQNLASLGAVAEQSLRSLRKLGLRDDIEQLLGEMADVILQGKDIKTLLRSTDPRNDVSVPLVALLHVAGAWYYFGRDQLVEPIVQTARTLLFGNVLTQAKQRRDLACAYAHTVGQAAPTVAWPRLEEIFMHLKDYRDTFTTSSHFSIVQMDLIESVILAVFNNDFTQGTQARRWLDQDEYLIRQRIHRDYRNMVGATGE